MADESIVIEVKDSVATSISAKLKDIAAQARDGSKAVDSLQKGLKSLDSGRLSSVSKDATGAAAAITKVQIANQNLATAEQKTAAAMTAAATATAKLQAAQDSAAAAAIRLATAQQRVADAAAKTAAKETAAKQAAALAAANAATEAAKLAAQTGKATAATDKYVMSAKAQAAAMRGVPAQITDIVVSLQGGQRPLTVLLQQGGQLKDMFGGVVPALRALAAGFLAMVNPVTIAIAAFAGFAVVVGMVESKMRDINGMVAQFKATGRDMEGSAIVELRKQLEQLEGVSKSTATEVIKSFASVRAVGGEQLKQAALLSRDLATALGTDTPTAAAKLAKALDDPREGMVALDKELGSFTAANFKNIDSLVKQGKTMEAQNVIISVLKNQIGGLTEESLTPMQKATNDLGNAWNKFTGDLNNSGPIKSATEALIGLLNSLTKMINKLDELFSLNPPDWVKTAGQYANKAVNLMNPVGALIEGAKGFSLPQGGSGRGAVNPPNAIVGNANIKTRTGAQYGKTTNSKLEAAGLKGKQDHTEENRAAALAKINLQLENEILLMDKLGPERDKQEMFDRIEETLLGKKIKLNADETAAIKSKINAVVELREISQAANKIYDDVKGPLREYNAMTKASNDLRDKGIIDAAEHIRVQIKVNETYENARDPLRQINKELDQQITLSKTRGTQTTVEQQMQSIANQLLTQGVVLRGEENDKLREKIALVQELNLQQATENTLLANSVDKRKEQSRELDAINKLSKDKDSGFTGGDKAEATNKALQSLGLDTAGTQVAADAQASIIENMYARINQALQNNLITEGEAANFRTQIWLKAQEQQLNSAQSFFTGLESLSSSSNKKLATIGKAAAISNAIIDTYKSATGAYASMASIPYVGPALGAAAAAAAIAAGMANVQAIRSQGTTGFMSGGYTGDMPTDKVAGNVHGQEFVMNAAATAQHGAGNLQALQDGSASIVANSDVGRVGQPATGAPAGDGGPSSTPAPVTNIRNINVLDPAMVGDFLGTPEGEQVFLNVIRRNPQSIRQTIQNG